MILIINVSHPMLCLAFLRVCSGLARANQAESSPAKPNFVLIYCDNLDYGDIGCFGLTLHRTPHIDRLAAEGIKLTSFYSTSSVCTPSRASLMTGCYPRRVSLHNTDPDGAVLRPVSPNGLHPDEITIAEVLQGLRHGLHRQVASWRSARIPAYTAGLRLLFRHSLQRRHDVAALTQLAKTAVAQKRTSDRSPVDRNQLTKRYTEQTFEFITAHRDRPFFVYLPHAMPGSTRAPYASERFRG